MIAMAKQADRSSIRVYDEKGLCIFTLSGELVGFTSTTVTTKSEYGRYRVYDHRGMFMYEK